MNRSRLTSLFCILLAFNSKSASAQQTTPADWPFHDPGTDSIAGISLNKAYEHLRGRHSQPVIVAVIDNGFDIEHEDLRRVIWVNKKEIPGNHIDDDGNGYIDDVHGWNFRSTPEGIPAENDQAESTRVYSRWRARFGSADTASMTQRDRNDFRMFEAAKKEYQRAVASGLDSSGVAYAYNVNYRSSQLIGDHADVREHAYGSPFMRLTPQLTHGTHVAGIIAADRTNRIGMDGVADNVIIMPIVATTATGDERDKDVANAIRYAVDNGARIINMSFSKLLSPDKNVVDDAVRYAETKNVLIVHAAGNDGMNDDSTAHYPIAEYLNGKTASNFLTVGWSRAKFDERLAHPNSDYGARTVGVFAPGSDIFSTLPGNRYGAQSGSSMSTPIASGVAALLFSYFPRLTAQQVKTIILNSSFKPDVLVNRPGSKEKVPFRTLSISGGIVNADAAVLMAIGMSKQ